MQQTSLVAYDKLRPRLGDKQATVLRLFTQHTRLYDQQIAYLLQWPINCVTGRRNELMKQNLIQKVGKITSKYPPYSIVNLYEVCV